MGKSAGEPNLAGGCCIWQRKGFSIVRASISAENGSAVWAQFRAGKQNRQTSCQNNFMATVLWGTLREQRTMAR
jgi:hypothetical protein